MSKPIFIAFLIMSVLLALPAYIIYVELQHGEVTIEFVKQCKKLQGYPIKGVNATYCLHKSTMINVSMSGE